MAVHVRARGQYVAVCTPCRAAPALGCREPPSMTWGEHPAPGAGLLPHALAVTPSRVGFPLRSPAVLVRLCCTFSEQGCMPQSLPKATVTRASVGLGVPFAISAPFWGALPPLSICKAAFRPQVHKSRCHLPSPLLLTSFLRLLPAPPKQSPVAMVSNPCRRESGGIKEHREPGGVREEGSFLLSHGTSHRALVVVQVVRRLLAQLMLIPHPPPSITSSQFTPGCDPAVHPVGPIAGMQPQGFLPRRTEAVSLPQLSAGLAPSPSLRRGPLSPQRCCVKRRRPGRIWQPASIFLSFTPSTRSHASSTASPSAHHHHGVSAQPHARPFLQPPLPAGCTEPGAGGANAITTRPQLAMLRQPRETALPWTRRLWGCPTPRAEQGSMHRPPLSGCVCGPTARRMLFVCIAASGGRSQIH